MHGGGSRRSYKISTASDALVHVRNASIAPMAIKTIKPGKARRRGRDNLSVHAMRSRSVEVCGVRHTES